MAAKCVCVKCEGEKVSSNCIVWEGKEYEFNSFNELIESLYDKVNVENKLDVKTISDKSGLTRDEIIQILIDNQVKAKAATSITTSTTSSSSTNCNINISSLDGCSTCSKTFCEKLQIMVNEIALLKAEVAQLKTQI
jgi:hypothetical protein